MKVILISGSPNANGNTAQLMDLAASAIRESGVDAEVVSFAGKKIEACIACRHCSKHGECGLKDGLNEIIDKIRHADGLIVGAPVYFGTARGDVMCALQRIGSVSRNSDNFLTGKVGGPVAVARRGGQTLSLQEMLMFFLINDMIVPGSTYWNMVFGRTPGEALEDEEGVATVKHFASNVANLVKRLSASA
ncbi:MAG: flavodoxin family protein [Capsulimonadaceae bacterium]|nr:flavodoxin family protein [Capsulimonadaceae bacterium]